LSLVRALRIGTRGSSLARAQAEHVAALLGALDPPTEVEIVILRVSGGEEGVGGPASDKSRWVDLIEQALDQRRIDLAVHSAKDVPGVLGDGLALLGAPPRADAADVLCGASGVETLAAGARVGTSSLRRAAQLRAAREDLRVVVLTGNVDTRLRRLDAGELDAIVLAHAGLQRLGLDERVSAVLDTQRFVPAPGQGTIALEGRLGDERVAALARAISDPGAMTCLLAERALARELEASCDTPLGAHAARSGPGRLLLRGWVGLPDGSAWESAEALGEHEDPDALGAACAARLRRRGAAELLRRAEEMSRTR
jgi:hydroxymethylbilane synthase